MLPGKKPPGKKVPGKKAPFIFKLLIVTSSRGVSRTPAVSIIDLLVSVVITVVTNVKKKLLFRFCGGRRFVSECINETMDIYKRNRSLESS